MIDFQNGAFFKLSPVDNHTYETILQPMLIPGEKLIQSFKTIRDGVVFTTERIFTINIQGLTGKKKDFTSLPYSKIQAFSVETAGVFDADSELDLWFSGLGKVRLEFISSAKVPEICRIISERTLSGGKVVQQKVPADTRHEPLAEQRREIHVERPAESSPVEPDPVYQRVEKTKEVEPILPQTPQTSAAIVPTSPKEVVLSLGTLFAGVPASAGGLCLMSMGHAMEGCLMFGIGIVLLLVSYFKQ